jgi:16S rRNA (cytosine967-C5)-methyltransferase
VVIAEEVAPARLAAYRILSAVRKGEFADHAFEHLAGSLQDGDRRLTQEVAYGVLRLRGRLDHLLGRLVRGGIETLEPQVLDILRIGAYQLLELDRVPAYAAVSEAVETARRVGRGRAGGLINAVLRRLSRLDRPQRMFPGRAEDPSGHLVTWGSHPRWLVERWLARWPQDDVERLIAYDNTRPALYVSVAEPVDEAIRRLKEAGMTATAVERVPGSIQIDSGRLDDALAVVGAVVQDPAAASVVSYMAVERGEPATDLCAAPGGKAALLALRGHMVRAFDVSRPRLARLVDTRRRLGLEQLQVAVADATRPPLSVADTVLLDVPCTGTGTLGRHPDARWRVSRAGLGQLERLQREMLDAAAELVQVGGHLVYATCSLEPEENEEQVSGFLRRRPDFVAAPPPAGAVADALLDAEGWLRVTPQRHGMDGVYAARLRRRAS